MATHQQQLSSAMKGAKVLMVGAGGIGCELLKTLALSGFQDIHIIDMDTIEVSNLNRQFLFRQSHVGQSKAKVARDAVLKCRPHISITPHHANVKDSEFNVDFFKQFSVVLNGLDNLEARRHVNRLCLAADVPLVESGTTGFRGQVDVHLKGKTECYECQPKDAPKTTYPICTISSTPSIFVHCIVWAKDLLFAKLFGDKTQENDLIVRSSDTSNEPVEGADAFLWKENEDIEQYGKRIYDHVFGYNIEMSLSNEEAWKNHNKPKPIYCRAVLTDELSQLNGIVNRNCQAPLSAMSTLGLKNLQDVWSLVENTRVFLEAVKLFFVHRAQDIGNLRFDKEDQLAVEFVTAAANIRATSFGIPLHSLFKAKGIAGNIIHAVATTNAIVAGLIVIEAIKLLQNDTDNYRMTWCNEYEIQNMFVMPVKLEKPNPACFICSESELTLEIDTSRTKLRDFVEKIVKAKLRMKLPLIMQGTALLYEVGDDLDEDSVANYARNLQKVLSELPAPVTSGTLLAVEDLQQEFTCNIKIVHREEFDDKKEPDGMVLSGWTAPPPVKLKKTLLAELVEVEKDGDVEISERTELASPAKKRQLSETKNEKQLERFDDDDELVMYDDYTSIHNHITKILENIN